MMIQGLIRSDIFKTEVETCSRGYNAGDIVWEKIWPFNAWPSMKDCMTFQCTKTSNCSHSWFFVRKNTCIKCHVVVGKQTKIDTLTSTTILMIEENISSKGTADSIRTTGGSRAPDMFRKRVRRWKKWNIQKVTNDFYKEKCSWEETFSFETLTEKIKIVELKDCEF